MSRITSITRKATTLFAALAISLSAASVAQAQPVSSGGPEKKGCTAAGQTHKHGSTFYWNGTKYYCDDGKGCQVENDKVTGKCSHMAFTLPIGPIRVPVSEVQGAQAEQPVLPINMTRVPVTRVHDATP